MAHLFPSNLQHCQQCVKCVCGAQLFNLFLQECNAAMESAAAHKLQLQMTLRVTPIRSNQMLSVPFGIFYGATAPTNLLSLLHDQIRHLPFGRC